MYSLPPGATSVAVVVTHPANTLNGSTMSTQLVYGPRNAVVPAPSSSATPAASFSCTVAATAIYSIYSEMNAYGTNSCTGNTTGISFMDLGVCLDWQNSSGGWEVQNCDTASTTHSPWQLDGIASHGCTLNQTHNWRDRANGHFTYNGTKITELPRSFTQETKCVD
jgi:hypothetical protein